MFNKLLSRLLLSASLFAIGASSQAFAANTTVDPMIKKMEATTAADKLKKTSVSTTKKTTATVKQKTKKTTESAKKKMNSATEKAKKSTMITKNKMTSAADKSKKSMTKKKQAATASMSKKININTATVEQLATIKGIGPKKSQAIVNYRKKQGKFTSLDQLTNIKGIGNGILNKAEPFLTLK